MHPSERSQEEYELTLTGEASTVPPLSLATLQQVRGENAWWDWLYVTPNPLTDMLTILSVPRPWIMSVHEQKTGRDRWIQSITLQTADPPDE
jgi:hypothetical protein